ncbi:MAG: hypothetical protein Kow00109_08330 [Acidobacteriota bacterium]
MAVVRRCIRILSRWELRFYCLIGLVSATAVSAGRSVQTTSGDWPEIQRLVQAGNYPAALQLLDRLRIEQPDDARTWFYSGMILARSGQPRQAQSQLEKAVELAPGELHYRLVCAEIQLRNGYPFRARETLQPLEDPAKQAQLLPDQLWFLSDLFYRAQQPEPALAVLRRYSEVRPDDDRIPFRLGQLLISLNDLPGAEAAFRRALQEGRHPEEARYGLGLTLFQQGRLEEARRVLEGMPPSALQSPQYAHLLASVLLGLEEPAAAVQVLQAVEARAEELPAILEVMARAYSRLGDPEQAREYRRRFMALDQASRQDKETAEKVHSLLQAGQEALRRGEVGEAEKSFLEALEQNPSNEMALGYLIGLYLTDGRVSQAAGYLERLQTVAPEAFETKYLTALLEYQRGNLDAALAEAQAAKALQPGFADLRNLLGNIFYRLGRFGEAAEEYEAAMRLQPNRAEFRRNYETAARKAGREPGAGR